MVPRRTPAVGVAVALLVCGTAGTACGPGAAPGLPRAEPLTEAGLMSVLPSGKELPGYTVTRREPAPAPSPGNRSQLAPGSREECLALVDFRLNHGLLGRPAARVVAAVVPRGEESRRRDLTAFRDLHSVELSSRTAEEAKALMASLRKAVPLCEGFLVYTTDYGDQDARIRVRPRRAPAAGDEAVAFDWTVPGIAMNETVPITVVRTGGVVAAYSGAVPAGIPREQHRRLRAFLSGSTG